MTFRNQRQGTRTGQPGGRRRADRERLTGQIPFLRTRRKDRRKIVARGQRRGEREYFRARMVGGGGGQGGEKAHSGGRGPPPTSFPQGRRRSKTRYCF